RTRVRARRAVLRSDPARSPVRVPVSPGEETGGRAAPATHGRGAIMEQLSAIDLLDGRAVRLEEGRRDRATVFHDRPVELVAELARGGGRPPSVVGPPRALW